MKALALQDEGKKLLKAVEKFANLKTIKSTEQVEQLFKGLHREPDKFQTISPSDVWAYRENEHENLRADLSVMVESHTGRKKVGEKISQQLHETVHPHLDFTHGRLVQSYEIDGVQAAIALGLAFLLDERYGLTNKLKKCRNPECGSFNFNIGIKGKPKSECNAKCKAKYDSITGAERQKRWRDNQK